MDNNKVEEDKRSPIENLPIEVLVYLFGLLGPRDLLAAALTCTTFNNLSFGPSSAWRIKTRELFTLVTVVNEEEVSLTYNRRSIVMLLKLFHAVNNQFGLLTCTCFEEKWRAIDRGKLPHLHHFLGNLGKMTQGIDYQFPSLDRIDETQFFDSAEDYIKGVLLTSFLVANKMPMNREKAFFSIYLVCSLAREMMKNVPPEVLANGLSRDTLQKFVTDGKNTLNVLLVALENCFNYCAGDMSVQNIIMKNIKRLNGMMQHVTKPFVNPNSTASWLLGLYQQFIANQNDSIGTIRDMCSVARPLTSLFFRKVVDPAIHLVSSPSVQTDESVDPIFLAFKECAQNALTQIEMMDAYYLVNSLFYPTENPLNFSQEVVEETASNLNLTG